MSERIPPPIHGRDLGAELRALNEQLRALSRREIARIEQLLETDLPADERAHLLEELARFRTVAETELD